MSVVQGSRVRESWGSGDLLGVRGLGGLRVWGFRECGSMKMLTIPTHFGF